MRGFRFFKVFIISFVVIFAVLNGRFLYAQVNYWIVGGAKPSQIQPTTRQATNRTLLPDEATLIIPKLGISAPIVFGVESDENTILKNLENGVVHYSDSPKPGLDGLSIILGHSSAYPWYRGAYGSVFSLLGKLEPGDNFSVQYSDGRKFNFAVKQSVVFSPFDNDSRLAHFDQADNPTLILVSCWPVGTNYKRIAVQAELI